MTPGTLPDFAWHAPTTLDEVVGLLEDLGPEALLMAGGTDLLPRMKAGRLSCTDLVGLSRVEDFDRVAYDPEEGLTIGAGAVLADVAAFEAVRQHYGVLARAISTLATPQTRHKATVAGNLCNASPCADTAPPLMALGSTVEVSGPVGTREQPLEHFIVGPGQTTLGPAEVLACIRVPVPPVGLRTTFLKHSPRSRVDISAVSVAVALGLAGGRVDRVDLFLGTVAPTPMRAAAAEAVLAGQVLDPELIARAAAAAPPECRPMTDMRASKAYKERMVEVLVRRALGELS